MAPISSINNLSLTTTQQHNSNININNFNNLNQEPTSPTTSDYSLLLREEMEAKLYYLRETSPPNDFDDLVSFELERRHRQATEAPVGFRHFFNRVREQFKKGKENSGKIRVF